MDLALALPPGIRNVAVVAGSTPGDLESAEQFRRETSSFADRELQLADQPVAAGLARRAFASPDHTLVLYLTMLRMPQALPSPHGQALALFAPASSAPIYGCYETYLGYGIVGGAMVTFEEIGRKAAPLGMRILASEEAQTAARTIFPVTDALIVSLVLEM